MNSITSAISSGSRMSIGASPSPARTNSRICFTLWASSEMAPRQGGTSKPLLSLPQWYLFARYTRLRPRTPTAERAALVTRKQIAGLLLADIVLNNLANRRSCCERKSSLPARPGSKTFLVCLGKPLVLRTAFLHSTFIRPQYGVPSCQAWQPCHEAQYVCCKLNLSSSWTDANTEFILLMAAMKSPVFLQTSASSCRLYIGTLPRCFTVDCQGILHHSRTLGAMLYYYQNHNKYTTFSWC